MPNNSLTPDDMQRIGSLSYLFMWHLQAKGDQYHVELVNTFSALSAYVRKKDKKIQQVLDVIKNKPIVFYLKNNPKVFSKMERKTIDKSYSLEELDYILTKNRFVMSKLRKEYLSTHVKRHRVQYNLKLSQILMVMSYIRNFVFREFVKLLRENGLEMPQIQLPITQQHSLTGVGIDGTTKTRPI